jgi:hypothetical protein
VSYYISGGNRTVGLPALAPSTEQGVTQVWDPGEDRVLIDDGVAVLLVKAGLVEWGGFYRVYRPCWGVTMSQIREALAVE